MTPHLSFVPFFLFRLNLTFLFSHYHHYHYQVTYGFVGLETVSIELDDPFGDDENDFDNLGMALVSTVLSVAVAY